MIREDSERIQCLDGGTLNTKAGETLQFEGKITEKIYEGNNLGFLCELRGYNNYIKFAIIMISHCED